MDVEVAYDKFQIKVNKNYGTGKISIDRGRFVLIFNEASNKLQEYILEKKNADDIRYIQKVHVSDHPISSSVSNKDNQTFKLPENYFDLSDAYALANKGNCKNKRITLFEIKDDNKGLIIEDENNEPSFLAREAPYHITGDTVKVYKKDFEYTKLLLSYYRYPVQIKLLNEEDPESGFDQNFNPEFDDKYVDRVISLAASEFELNNESQKSQHDKARAGGKL